MGVLRVAYGGVAVIKIRMRLSSALGCGDGPLCCLQIIVAAGMQRQPAKT